jgi:hypothetical protein
MIKQVARRVSMTSATTPDFPEHNFVGSSIENRKHRLGMGLSTTHVATAFVIISLVAIGSLALLTHGSAAPLEGPGGGLQKIGQGPRRRLALA